MNFKWNKSGYKCKLCCKLRVAGCRFWVIYLEMINFRKLCDLSFFT